MLLQKAAQDFQFELITLSDYLEQEKRISSTWIRELLKNGNLEQAQLLLGHPVSISGHVCQGDQRGRTWGIPTANILLHHKTLPFTGIFIVEFKILNQSAKTYHGAASLGIRPMFSEPRGILEVHLLDFSGDFIWFSSRSDFLKKLRDEEIFSTEAELIQQIHEDIKQCRVFFNECLS